MFVLIVASSWPITRGSLAHGSVIINTSRHDWLNVPDHHSRPTDFNRGLTLKNEHIEITGYWRHCFRSLQIIHHWVTDLIPSFLWIESNLWHFPTYPTSSLSSISLWWKKVTLEVWNSYFHREGINAQHPWQVGKVSFWGEGLNYKISVPLGTSPFQSCCMFLPL